MNTLVEICCSIIARNIWRYQKRLKWLPSSLLERIFNTFDITLTRRIFLLFRTISLSNTDHSCFSYFENISFNKCNWLYDKDINEILLECTRLRSFSIRNCSNITRPNILSSSLHKLEFLDFKKEEFCPKISAPNLTEVSMNMRARITRKKLKEIQDQCGHIFFFGSFEHQRPQNVVYTVQISERVKSQW